MKKKRRPRIIKNKKQRGEWAEMQFMARAAEEGFSVSKPWGESRGFDVVVERKGEILSVQVKSTINLFDGGYYCHVGAGHGGYPPGAFDFLAAYVIVEDAWYIIPEKVVRGMQSISLFPRSDDAKYEPYREAWKLLRGGPDPGVAEQPEQGAGGGAAAEAAPRFPRNALERVEAAMNFARRQMEGNYPRKRKPEE